MLVFAAKIILTGSLGVMLFMVVHKLPMVNAVVIEKTGKRKKISVSETLREFLEKIKIVFINLKKSFGKPMINQIRNKKERKNHNLSKDYWEKIRKR
jgi:hypothetical protein